MCRSFHVFDGSFHVLRGGFHVFGIHRKLRWRCDASIGQRYKEKRAVGVKYRLLRTLGVGGHNAVNAAAAPLHVVQAGEYIRNHLIAPHRRNVPQIHVLDPAAIGHAARRRNLHAVIEHFNVYFRAENLIVAVNQRIYQHLTDGLVGVVAAFFARHAANAPRIFAIVADEILCVLQQRNQTGTLIFFVVQCIGIDIALVRALPAGAEYARLRQYTLVA